MMKKVKKSKWSVTSIDGGDESNVTDDLDHESNDAFSDEEENTVVRKRKRMPENKNDAKPKVKSKKIKNASHKDNIQKLKQVDPSFYEYLEQNDQELLNFDDDDSEDGEDDEGPLHKPPESLEVASDESDYEGDEKVEGLVTLKMVDEWEKRIQKDKTTRTLKHVLEAFEAALQSISPEEERVATRYRVNGSAVFNAVLRLCIVHIPPAIRLILNRKPGQKIDTAKNKSWVKVRNIILAYLKGLTKLSDVTSPEVLTVLLKHLHGMLPYAAPFGSVTLQLTRKFINLWVSDSDVVRVLAFLCLIRTVHLRPSIYKSVLKKMYFAFVRNSKFVSPTTLAPLNFMRQSMAEMFVLDPVNSYEPAFLYIRQLSIHLRNAITLKKKEHYQAVHNWQFVESLHLWTEVLGLSPKDSPLYRLIHPVVQITMGTVDLIPSAEFYPLRFHCAKFLLSLSEKTGVFIPVLPMLLEVLKTYDFNQKHKKASMKPMDLRCSLRVSKLQRQENGFKDAVIESIQALMLEAFAIESYRLSFPDVIVPSVIQVKQFLKTCNVAKYCKQIKSVLDKAMENAKMVELERSKASVQLNDPKSIATAETLIRTKGTPLAKYFETWTKLNNQQLAKRYFNNDQIGDYKLPNLKKFEKRRSENEGPVELFPSSDDSDLDMPVEEVEKRKKKTKTKKVVKKDSKPPPTIDLPTDFDPGDIVKDIDLSDFE